MYRYYPLIVLSGLFAFNPYGNYYTHKWYALLLLIIAFLCWEIKKKFNWQIALFSIYFVSSSILIGLGKIGPYAGAKKSILFEALSTGIYGVGILVLLAYGNMHRLKKSVGMLVPIAAIYTIIGYVYGWEFQGFGANVSVNATLLSMLLPFAMTPLNIVLVLAAILTTKASIGLIAFCGAVFAYFFIKSANKGKFLLISSVVGTVSFVIFYLIYGATLWTATGRLPIWEFCLNFTWERQKWFGTGAGTFSHIMPVLQSMKVFNEHPGEYFIYLHNDIIQLFFETGIIGVLLAIIAVGSVVKKAWGNPMLIAYGTAWLINSIGNFPNHLATTTLLTIIYLSIVFQKGEKHV